MLCKVYCAEFMKVDQNRNILQILFALDLKTSSFYKVNVFRDKNVHDNTRELSIFKFIDSRDK